MISPLLKLLDSPERSFRASEFKLTEREMWQLKEVGFSAKELKKQVLILPVFKQLGSMKTNQSCRL